MALDFDTIAAKAADWLTTSSSIIGIALGTPTVAAVIAGDLPLSAAIYPLAGAALAVLMPQRAPGQTRQPTLAEALTAAARIAAQVQADRAGAQAPSFAHHLPAEPSQPATISLGGQGGADALRTAPVQSQPAAHA